MGKGISIHVGVSRPAAFPESELTRCEDDASVMLQIAKEAGFSPILLLGEDATVDKVVQVIQDAATKLTADDTFLFTFAGHGTRDHVTVDTINEPDGIDESIALADHFLLDNFWRSDLWPSFKPGVRAITVADCCKGGGVFLILNFLHETLSATSTARETLGPQFEGASRLLERTSHVMSLRKSSHGSRMFFTQPFSKPAIGQLVLRRIPDKARLKELRDFEPLYKKQRVPPTKPITIERLFLAACEETEDAVEGENHGAFTQVMLDVWNDGKFVGNYRDFMAEIGSKFSGTIQHPNIKPDPPPNFSNERPFTI